MQIKPEMYKMVDLMDSFDYLVKNSNQQINEQIPFLLEN